MFICTAQKSYNRSSMRLSDMMLQPMQGSTIIDNSETSEVMYDSYTFSLPTIFSTIGF